MRPAAVAIAGLLLAGLSQSAAAQDRGRTFAGPSPQMLEATAALRPLNAADPTPDLRLPTVAVQSAHGGHGQAVALMIVGAAGIVTGLIVDEAIITIAGAAAAGIGLYLYLR